MSNPRSNELRYVFSKDPVEIEQYIRLRRTLYSSDEKLQGFRFFSHIGSEDYSQSGKQMLLVFDKGRCVGGGCLTVSTPENAVSLPLEEEFLNHPRGKFFLRKRFRSFILEKKRYCELSRIILHPEYRDGNYVTTMFYHFVQAAKQQSCRYIFGIGDKVRLRNNRHIFTQRLGLKSQIFFDIELPQKPDFEGKKMYVMVVYCGDQ